MLSLIRLESCPAIFVDGLSLMFALEGGVWSERNGECHITKFLLVEVGFSCVLIREGPTRESDLAKLVTRQEIEFPSLE